MTAQETSVANWFSTTLSGTVSNSDTTFPVASIGALTSPCFIVIDPESATKREVVLCDGTFGGASFVTSSGTNRGLSGSAAGAQGHDSGTPVVVAPLAQHVEDLHDRIDEIIDGTTAFTGALSAPDGSAAAPAFSFSGDTDTGIYRYSGDHLAFSTGGTLAARFDSNQNFVPSGHVSPAADGTKDLGSVASTWRYVFGEQFRADDGTASAPSYSFNGDTDTGMYWGASGNIRFTTDNDIAMAITTSVINSYRVLQPVTGSTYNLGAASKPWLNLYADRVLAGDGTTLAPAYSFSDDADTGFYRAATGQINVTNNNNIGFLFGPSINVTYRNLRGDADNTRQLGTSSIAFSKTYSHQYVMGTTGPTISFGTGTPEGAVTAPVGSLFLRTNGGAGTTLYVKESGAGNTGWAAK